MSFFNRNKTFKPIKAHGVAADSKRDQLSAFAKKTLATLGSGSSMEAAVKLPKGEDLNEWLAVNTVDFFNEISMLYGTISEYCTKGSCPTMSAGPSFQYRWMDGVKVKKPVEVSAPEYVDLLLTWVESQLNDEAIFPIQIGGTFPKNFQSVVKTIFKRYFRVYAHIYHSHFARIARVGAEAHLNTCFKHFLAFVNEFKLIEAKELEPLSEVIASMTKKESAKGEEKKDGPTESPKAEAPKVPS